MFRRTAPRTWTQTAKLTADDGAQSDGFGSAVAIAGDYAFVGASGAGNGSPLLCSIQLR